MLLLIAFLWFRPNSGKAPALVANPGPATSAPAMPVVTPIPDAGHEEEKEESQSPGPAVVTPPPDARRMDSSPTSLPTKRRAPNRKIEEDIWH